MSEIRVLWADDEIDLLKPQIMFLEDKGYTLVPVTNGQDAIEKCKQERFDVVILDESMPGLTGLETLTKIKEINQQVPIIMITKNEEEDLMEQAIGSQISDYLIKPVKPQQVLSSLKKLIDNKRLVSERTNAAYQQEFQKLFMALQDKMDVDEWMEFYKKLVYWELELEKSEGGEMSGIFDMQKVEANREFSKFVSSNYLNWMSDPDSDNGPLMSHSLMRRRIFQYLKKDKPTVLVVIDNLRLDQWKIIQPFISRYFSVDKEENYLSILPTATQYARNALFAGLTPLQIRDHFPEYWKFDEEDGGKNMFEDKLLSALLDRSFHEPLKHSYFKVTNVAKGKELLDNALNYVNNDLSVIVYNFVDMLSHARTEMEVLKELAGDEAAYRSLTASWFEHSPLFESLKKLADRDINLLITTDHGTKRVSSPSKCVGDRSTTTNIRYKSGKNLNYIEKDVFTIQNPAQAQLPQSNVSSRYIFGKEDVYLVYQNNYNQFVNYFRDTFQHGGISLEEMIIPFIVCSSK